MGERIANIAPDMVMMSKRGLNRAYEVMGFRTALQVGADIQALSTFRKSAGEFGRIAQEKGLKAALDWRDGPFQDYGAAQGSDPPPRRANPLEAILVVARPIPPNRMLR